jgi:hypothetical protein
MNMGYWYAMTVVHRRRQVPSQHVLLDVDAAASGRLLLPSYSLDSIKSLTSDSLSQTVQQETEFQQGIDDIRGKRRAAGSTAAGQQLSQAAVLAQEEQQAEQQIQEAAMLYARCLQHLLKVGCCAVHHARAHSVSTAC